MNEAGSHINFVIGADKRLADIVSGAELEPLLRSLVIAGPLYAAVLDEDCLPLCSHGKYDPLCSLREIRHELVVEGEPKGTLLAVFGADQANTTDALAFLARDAIQLIINNNLKRMLTTEVHTTVIQDSYIQLTETNRQLMKSEQSYRELALSLEQIVEQRTAELKKAYARMLQQEKLAAVGTLAAGMAHEINNPNGFVRSNLETFGRYFQKTREMLNYFQQQIANNTPLPKLQQESEIKRKELKLDFIISDTPELLAQSIEGTDRIARIVTDLKSFSRLDGTGESDVDLNTELEQTLAVLAPQIMAGSKIELDLNPLPFYWCNPGLMAQAFKNIIQNAFHSRKEGLELSISSNYCDSIIEICIRDNGCGIAEKNLSQVFDPFFTTRDVGSGTGMGLTVSREIIHGTGGTINISSKEEIGTSVTIILPLKPTER